MRREEIYRVVIAALSIGLLAAGFGLYYVNERSLSAEHAATAAIRANRETLRELKDAERLVRALQRQVEKCRRTHGRCGPPLTSAPRPSHPAAPTPVTVAPTPTPAPASPRPRPTRSPTSSPSPRPSHTPKPSPSPSPSPSPQPTCSVQHPLRCLPGG